MSGQERRYLEWGVASFPRLLECFKNVQMIFQALSRAYAGTVPYSEVCRREKRTEKKPGDDGMHGHTTEQRADSDRNAVAVCVDSTVMEVDLEHGDSPVVCMPNRDFEPFQPAREGNVK